MVSVGSSPAIPQPLWQRLCWLVVTGFVAILFALFTYLQPGAPLEPGLDSSWAYALNYIYQQKLVVGRDIFFTFGPLGFLEHTRGLTHEMVYQSSIFWFVLSIILIANLLSLAFCRPVSWWHRGINILLVLALVIMVNTHTQRLLMLLYTSVFLHWYRPRLFYLLLLAITSAICLLVKFSYGVAALAMTMPYLVLVAWRERSLRNAAIGAMTIPLCYAGVWYSVYGHLDGMLGYIQGGLEFSRGSTSAMAQNPQNEWPAIALYYISFFLALGLVDREQGERAPGKWHLPLSLCFIGPLFIWSKYAFGREDSGHLMFLMLFVVYLIPVMALVATRFRHIWGYAFALLACLFGWQQMHNRETGTPVYESRPVFFMPETFPGRWKPDLFIDAWMKASERKLESLHIPPAMQQQIGNGTVDIYPWETLVTAANKLAWVPRPVFQNYITYTPFLDRANRDFYASERAPQFLLWHYHSFADIDNRFPFSSDPLTLQSILRHYQQVSCEGQFCLWKRTAQHQLDDAQPVTSVMAQWEEWIPVPATAADIVQANTVVNRTWLGKLNLALWKEGGVKIDYRLSNGTVQTHTLVVDNAVSGLWASPYLTTFYQSSKLVPVTQQQVAAYQGAARAEGFIEKLEAAPNGLHVMGWGLLPFLNTQTQTVKVLLFNEQHAYEATLVNRHRPGISDFFGKAGQVDLDQSGFDEVIPTRDMVPGDYQVRLVIENEGQTSVTQETGYRTTVAPAATVHNVEAIRFHSLRPWAFQQAIQVDWHGLSFAERTPW